jgi:hypothetical protein
MCDLVGLATEDLVAAASNASYRTDWKLNPDHPYSSLRFDWLSGSSVSGKTCRSDPRRVLTYLMGRSAHYWGLASGSVAPARDRRFKAWLSDIFWSFSLLPQMTFSNGRDLLSATAARSDACLQDPNCQWQAGPRPVEYSYILYSNLNVGFWSTDCAN